MTPEDELAVMRQDVAALRRRVDELEELLGNCRTLATDERSEPQSTPSQRLTTIVDELQAKYLPQARPELKLVKGARRD